MELLKDQNGVLIVYNRWANNRLLAQLKTLSQDEFVRELGGSFPSPQRTLNHLLESDWIWLNRWLGQPIVDVPAHWDTRTASAIEALWTDIQQRTQDYFASVLPQASNDLVHFQTRRGDQLRMPLWQLIHHVANHGTYHRGQLANMLRMLGHQPVATDSFIFFNEINPD